MVVVGAAVVVVVGAAVVVVGAAVVVVVGGAVVVVVVGAVVVVVEASVVLGDVGWAQSGGLANTDVARYSWEARGSPILWPEVVNTVSDESFSAPMAPRATETKVARTRL